VGATHPGIRVGEGIPAPVSAVRQPAKVSDVPTLIAAAVILAIVWGPSLFWSFWVDEAITCWLAHDGPLSAIVKWQHWAGHSIVYSILASPFAGASGAWREFVLRIPTIGALILAAWFVYRLAEDAIGKGSGAACAVLFVFHPLTLGIGNQARPYAFAWAALVASMWALYRWVSTGQRRYLAGWVIASALMFELRMLFAVVFVAQAVYLVMTLRRRWRELFVACGALAVLLLPLLPQLRMLLHEAPDLSFADKPHAEDLLAALIPSLLLFGSGIATLAMRVCFPAPKHRPVLPATPFMVLLVVWMSFGTVLFFCLSVLSRSHLFVPRYYSFLAPAQALLLGAAGYALFGPARAGMWSLLAILASVGSPLGWTSAPRHGPEELRPFMDIIQGESRGSSLPPVFFRSEQPESDAGDWRAGISGDGYLYSPFVVYPMRNRLLPLPFHLTPAIRAHVTETIRTDLATSNEVLFVTHDGGWIPWMAAQMQAAGFHAETRHPNNFYVVIFRRT